MASYGERFSVVSVLDLDYEGFCLFGYGGDPWGFWDTIARSLSTKNQYNWAFVSIKEAIFHIIPLFPEDRGQVTIMIQKLIKKLHNLFTTNLHHFLIRIVKFPSIANAEDTGNA